LAPNRAHFFPKGEWYYGTVRLEDIEQLFNLAEMEKAVVITSKPVQPGGSEEE